MPKSKKALLKPQQPPFLIKVLLFLAAMGVNINRPPPMKKLVASAMAFLLLLFFLLFRPNNALNIIAPLSERPDRSTVRCARTFPAVASHQLFVGEPMVKSGGLEAMDYLRDGFGVTNFDIDAVQLKDGTLLAAHPQRLYDRIQKDAKEVTLKEARALGADERSFVLLEDLIEHFATSTVRSKKKKSSGPPVGWKGVSRKTTWLSQEFGKNVGGMSSSSSKQLIGIDGMFFGVDLKGEALNVENVVLVNEYAKKANVVDAVSYYVTDPESEASKNIQKALESSFPKSEDRIKTTWALRDVDSSHWDTEKLAKENLERMKIHGLLPSAKFDEKWYSKAVKESNAWVESWVADDLETALALRKKGAHAMISNVPESLIEGIKQFCMHGENYDLAIEALAKMRV